MLNLLIQIGLLNDFPVLNVFLMTSPRIFLEGRCFFFLPKPLKPWEYEVPRSIGFMVVVMENDHKVAACLYAKLSYWGTRALGKVLFLDCLLEWNVPEQTHPRLCPIPSSFLTRVSWTHPSSCNITLWSVLSPVAWATLRKEAGGGTPPPGNRSPRGFSKLFQPRGSTFSGFSRHSFTAGGPSWVWRL